MIPCPTDFERESCECLDEYDPDSKRKRGVL